MTRLVVNAINICSQWWNKLTTKLKLDCFTYLQKYNNGALSEILFKKMLALTLITAQQTREILCHYFEQCKTLSYLLVILLAQPKSHGA